MADLISREDVIRLLVDKYKFTTSEATEILSELPSAVCDDCIWSVCNYNKVGWDTPSAEAEPKRVLQGYCKGADCKWWNPQVEGCNRCVFVEDEYTHPSAEAVQGEWVDIDDYYRMATCSHCQKVTMFEKWGEYTKPYNFCPNCGSRMTKGGDTE